MWRLAIKAMFGDRGKFLTSLAGVSFSVVLVNMQAGLLQGFLMKTSLLIDQGQADIWVGHRHMNNVDMNSFIPDRWLDRIRGLEGVERADAYLIVNAEVKMPDGRFELVLLLGCEPGSPLGNAWSMVGTLDPAAVLRSPDGVIIDRHDVARLGDCRIGDVREINGRRACIVGMTERIVGFTGAPYVFTTLERARNRFTNAVPAKHCSFFLVKAQPSTNLPALCAEIRKKVPEVSVHDRDSWSRQTMMHWLTKTGMGISFGLTIFLGLLVGLAVVAQTLYATVNERVKEFATLKALGVNDRGVLRFLFAQALGIALGGSTVGLVAIQIMARLMSSAEAPVVLSVWASVLSVALITLICLIAGWLPFVRICRIDPASVLRG
ncbi:MAG: ABC transporter permease [Gemmataceae bacterium]